MGRFDDYNQVADPLVLHINGHAYTLPEVGMKDGIRLSTQEDDDAEPISNDELRRMLLGDAYDRMVEDNVPAVAVSRALTTAYADFSRGREMAELMWQTGGDPKALETLVRRRNVKQPQDRASKRSTGTASARKTPSRASTNATKGSPTSK